MNFQLKHRQVTCPQELVDSIESKVTRFERLIPENSFLEVELIQHAKAHGDGDKEAEVILDIPGVKPVIRFTAIGTTFLEAVDRIFDQLDEELGRRKNREGDHHVAVSPKEWSAEEAHKEAVAPTEY
ncbi:MAG TPA: HPF/RaiA family ribosome-associated protein [Patescibacteria group bacterium]